MFNKVDLPQPDGPITAKNSPGATSNVTLSSAVRPSSAAPKRIVMASTARIGGAAACTGIARSLVETTATGSSASGACHRRGHGGGIAGLDPHIDDGDPAGIDCGDGLFQHAGKIARLGDRTE